MSSQASVRSIDSLKDLRVALALYGEDTLGALGAVEAEVRRTLRWLQEERPFTGKSRSSGAASKCPWPAPRSSRKTFRKGPITTRRCPSRKRTCERPRLSLQDAEKRLAAVKKWQPLFKQAALEYHASIQRLKDLAAATCRGPSTCSRRMIDSLEAYLRVAPPSGVDMPLSGPGGTGAATMAIPAAQVDSVAAKVLDEDEAAAAREAKAQARELARANAEADGRPRSRRDGCPRARSHADEEARRCLTRKSSPVPPA